MKQLILALACACLLVNGCDSDSLRRIGRVVAGEIPVIGAFVGEWLFPDGEKALDVTAKSDVEALVKQYVDSKLELVATHAYAVGDSLLMEFARQNLGPVTGKLTSKGELKIAYPDTTLTWNLTGP